MPESSCVGRLTLAGLATSAGTPATAVVNATSMTAAMAAPAAPRRMELRRRAGSCPVALRPVPALTASASTKL